MTFERCLDSTSKIGWWSRIAEACCWKGLWIDNIFYHHSGRQTIPVSRKTPKPEYGGAQTLRSISAYTTSLKPNLSKKDRAAGSETTQNGMPAALASAKPRCRSWEPTPVPRYSRSTTTKTISVTVSACSVLRRTGESTIVFWEVQATCYFLTYFSDSSKYIRTHFSRRSPARSRHCTLVLRLGTGIYFWLSLPFLLSETDVSNYLSSLIVGSLQIQHIRIFERACYSCGVLLPLCSFIRPILPEESIYRERKL
jgi:hypothetical protein